MEDVIKVVRVGMHTLDTRLIEFEKTAAANLTIDEWEKDEQKKLRRHYPPSYVRNRIQEQADFDTYKKALLKRKSVIKDEYRPKKIQRVCEPADDDSNQKTEDSDETMKLDEIPDIEEWVKNARTVYSSNFTNLNDVNG